MCRMLVESRVVRLAATAVLICELAYPQNQPARYNGPTFQGVARQSGLSVPYQFNEVRGGGRYLSQNDLRLHFGLGSNSKIDDLEIAWPSGLVERLAGPLVDQIYNIEEGKGMRPQKNPATP
jgi:hypothetical protein